MVLAPVLLEPDWSAFANSEDPDRLASSETNWSGFALLVIECVNSYQTSGSGGVFGWGFGGWACRLEVFSMTGVNTLQSFYNNAGRVQGINGVS